MITMNAVALEKHMHILCQTTERHSHQKRKVLNNGKQVSHNWRVRKRLGGDSQHNQCEKENRSAVRNSWNSNVTSLVSAIKVFLLNCTREQVCLDNTEFRTQ